MHSHITLKYAAGGDSAAYFATYYALTTLCYAGSTVVGGLVFDLLEPLEVRWAAGQVFDRYSALFWFSWITRSLTVVWVLWLVEPGAWSWRAILLGQRSAVETRAATHTA